MPKRGDRFQPSSVDGTQHDRTEKGMRSSSVASVPVEGHPGASGIGDLIDYISNGSVGLDHDNDDYMRQESQRPNQTALDTARRTAKSVIGYQE